MTILSQVSVAHTFRLDLGKLCLWCLKPFLSIIGFELFQSQMMTVPFFWMELGEGLWTCPAVLLQLWGRGKDLEGWSGSHVKAGPSPWWTVCCEGLLSAPLHLQGQMATPDQLHRTGKTVCWVLLGHHQSCELPTWSAGMKLRWAAAIPGWAELRWLQRINPDSESRGCAWLFTVCSRTGGLLSSRRTSFTPSEAGIQKMTFFIL